MSDTAIALSSAEVLAAIRQAVNAAGSQAAFSRKCGIAPSIVSEVLSGAKPAPPAMVVGAGFMPVTRYVPIRRG